MDRKEWRLIIDHHMGAGGIDAYERAIAEARAENLVPDTALFGFPALPILSVGSRLEIEPQVHLDKVKEYGVGLSRRSSGGGGVMYLPEGLMAWLMWYHPESFPGVSFDEMFKKLGAANVAACEELGVKGVWYKHIADILVGDKKIAGNGLGEIKGMVVVEGYINHGIMDMDLFMKVAKIPEEKFVDKKAKSAAEWITNVEAEIGKKPEREEVIEALRKGLEKHLGISLKRGELTGEEKLRYEKYEREVTSDEFLFSISAAKQFAKIPPGAKLGSTIYKARKLICTHVLVDKGGKIEDLLISGDFFCKKAEYLKDLATSLKGIDVSDHEAIRSKVDETFSRPGWEAPMIEPEDLVKPLIEAAGKALQRKEG
jgi:lipoate-protein ligase A